MQMSVLPCQTVWFKIYLWVEVIWSSIIFFFFLFLKIPVPWWSSIIHSYIKNAEHSLLWTPSLSDLGHGNPYRVIHSISRACSTSCISWGAGVQPMPWTCGHGYGIRALCPISLIPSCWSCCPCRIPARAYPSPNSCVVQAELNTSTDFCSCWAFI